MIRPLTAAVGCLVSGVLLVGCTSPAQTPAPSTPSPGAASGSPSQAAVQGVSVQDAVLTLSGKDATLKATINNGGKQAVKLRAVACSAAGMVQLGTPDKDTLKPLSTGLQVPTGKTAAIGDGKVVVKLTGVTAAVAKGKEVAMQAYFGTAGVVEFKTKVA